LKKGGIRNEGFTMYKQVAAYNLGSKREYADRD
jgi:hypothetical protein